LERKSGTTGENDGEGNDGIVEVIIDGCGYLNELLVRARMEGSTVLCGTLKLGFRGYS
jgi:hypothetical protein